MKKILGIILVFSFVLMSANAFAFNRINSYWDLNAIDDGTSINWADDGITELFYELTYYAETNSVIENGGAVGATVTDAGLGKMTGFNFVSGDSPGDNENFGNSDAYGMGFAWNDLTGVVTFNDGSTVEATYNSGTFNFYIDYNPYAMNFNTPSTVTDGTLFATIDIDTGSYALDLTGNAGSSYILEGTFSYILPGFWFMEGGQDLSELVGLDWVVAYSAGDNDPNSTILTTNAENDLLVWSPHDSSIEIGAVPEPATMALFGIGLICLAGVSRRRA